MDENEINEALNELSGRMAGHIKALSAYDIRTNAHALELLSCDLDETKKKLDALVDALKSNATSLNLNNARTLSQASLGLEEIKKSLDLIVEDLIDEQL